MAESATVLVELPTCDHRPTCGAYRHWNHLTIRVSRSGSQETANAVSEECPCSDDCAHRVTSVG